jgi:hypothetical protein
MIQEYYRQMRKFGCNILAVVQQYDIIKDSAVRGAMIGNSKMLLKLNNNRRSGACSKIRSVARSAMTEEVNGNPTVESEQTNKLDEPPRKRPINVLLMHPPGTVMCPSRPDWEGFMDRLTGPEGCNINADGRGNVESKWFCYGDHRFARKLLAEYGVDVEASVNFFQEFGGFCDCEIIWNVEDGFNGMLDRSKAANG